MERTKYKSCFTNLEHVTYSASVLSCHCAFSQAKTRRRITSLYCFNHFKICTQKIYTNKIVNYLQKDELIFDNNVLNNFSHKQSKKK